MKKSNNPLNDDLFDNLGQERKNSKRHANGGKKNSKSRNILIDEDEEGEMISRESSSESKESPNMLHEIQEKIENIRRLTHANTKGF